jgi:hypothetical protein
MLTRVNNTGTFDVSTAHAQPFSRERGREDLQGDPTDHGRPRARPAGRRPAQGARSVVFFRRWGIVLVVLVSISRVWRRGHGDGEREHRVAVPDDERGGAGGREVVTERGAAAWRAEGRDLLSGYEAAEWEPESVRFARPCPIPRYVNAKTCVL